MSRCRIYFITDNRYAKELLRRLIQLLKEKDLVSRDVDVRISNPVNACDIKMERYLKGAIDDYDCVVILIDSEGAEPSEIHRRVFEEHVKDVDKNLLKVKIIVAHPCLEEWLCEAMNLPNCNTGSCNDLIRAIESTLKDKYKKGLPTLMEKRLSKLPRQLHEVIEAINTWCKDH